VGQAAPKSLERFSLKRGFVTAATGIGAALLIAALNTLPGLQARPLQSLPSDNELHSSVQLAALPEEARVTQRLIHAGGPFPYAKDGSVFANRERLLPRKPRGYYREYTVRTRYARDRGARRIVCGGEPPTHPEACYYTADHYASFRLIVQ
jgi:ribonuclease T1